MNGGYQTLDLRTATAGDPVTIKGSYDVVKGSNGKAILVEDKDGQEVFAQSKEVDGDYVITYISAEGKTVKVTITDEDAVTTVIEDDAASIEALTQGLSEISERLDANVFSNTYTQIQSYNSAENTFTTPTDGYFCYALSDSDASGENTTLFKTKNGTFTGIKNVPSNGTAFRDLLFVKKGMEAYFTLQTNTIIYFMSLVNE